MMIIIFEKCFCRNNLAVADLFFFSLEKMVGVGCGFVIENCGGLCLPPTLVLVKN